MPFVNLDFLNRLCFYIVWIEFTLSRCVWIWDEKSEDKANSVKKQKSIGYFMQYKIFSHFSAYLKWKKVNLKIV